LLLVAAGAVWSPDALAQPAKRFRIGVVNTTLAANSPMVEGLRAGLKELGLQEDDVSFDVRFTRGDVRALSRAAEELAKAGVDLIFANGDAAARAAKAATLTIPIVFTAVPDPVAAGLVRDLAKPDGNLTGVSSLTTDLVPKRLEILKALPPNVGPVLSVQPPVDAAARSARSPPAAPTRTRKGSRPPASSPRSSRAPKPSSSRSRGPGSSSSRSTRGPRPPWASRCQPSYSRARTASSSDAVSAT